MSDVLTITDLQAAKKHDTFHSEVITGKAGGSVSGAEIDTATNAVTGQVQTTLPKVLRDIGFKPASFNFVTGGTLGLADADKCIYNPAPAGDGNWYSWGGVLPHAVVPGTDPTLPGSGYVPRTDVILRAEITPSVFEALRRSYAEAGLNLVDGSFEEGGTLTSASDVLLHKTSGKAYSGPIGAVAAGTNPSSGSFVDASSTISNPRTFRSFGATGLGVADDTAALQSAINWAGSAKGRRVYGTPGDIYRITGELTVHWDGKFLDESSSCIIDFTGTTINADANSMTALRISRNYVKLINPSVDSYGSRSDVTAYALAPESETQTTQKVSQMFCEIQNPSARNVSIGIRFQPGPTVNGQDSGSFYHCVYNPKFHNVNRGFYFARSVTGSNLTTRVGVYSPIHTLGHCAWDIEAADSLSVYGGSAEFINQSGAHSGNPTIKIHKPVAGDALSSSNICFHRYYGEAGTTPFDISMPTEQVSMPGCTFFYYANNGLNNGTYALQNMFQNEGAIVSRAKYSPGSTAMLAVRRDVGANQGQAYLKYVDRESYPAELYADRGFTFAAPIDVARIADLQNTATNSQVIGSSLARINIVGSADTGTALFYNTSSLNGRAIEFGGVYSVGPNSDNSVSAGRPAARYSTVYAATGTINTSDAREKTKPIAIDDSILDAWGEVQLVAFQWLQSVAEKGDLARWHFGVIAQQVNDAFTKKGIDGVRFGLLCYDKWDGAPAITNGDGVEVVQPRSAGDRWGIRADQCLFLEAAYQRRRSERIEARLDAAGL